MTERTLPPASKFYANLTSRKLAFITIVALLALAFFLTDVMTGPAWLPLGEVLKTIAFPRLNVGSQTHVIVWLMRLPTAVMALVVGGALGLAGAQMQTILDNPLASPYTLGIASAASFGAALAIIAGSSLLPLPENLLIAGSALFFSLLAALAIYAVGRAKRGATETIILAGVALVFLFSSLVSLLQYIADENQLQAIVFWIFGSLTRATWPRVGLVSLTLAAVLPFCVANAWRLTALRLGDTKAQSLGVNVERLRLKVLISMSILTAIAVCFVGAIGFIGLVAPHLARSFVGEEQRFFMPLSTLTGAALLAGASVLSKLIIPGIILPIGVITSLLGIPFLISIVLKRRAVYWSA